LHVISDLISTLFEWIQSLGYFGIMIGLMIEVIPSVYWIGRYGGRPVLEKYGKYILIQKKHIDHSEEWFNKYGTGVIFTARFIPVVRHAISVPAGISKMPLGKFTLLTTLAVIPWSALFVYLGMTLGNKWEDIDKVAAKYTNEIILVAIALIIIYFVFKWYKSKKKGTTK